jgi:hypothetical protein
LTDDARFWRQRYTELLQTHAQFVAWMSQEDNAGQAEQIKDALTRIAEQVKAANGRVVEQQESDCV